MKYCYYTMLHYCCKDLQKLNIEGAEIRVTQIYIPQLPESNAKYTTTRENAKHTCIPADIQDTQL